MFWKTWGFKNKAYEENKTGLGLSEKSPNTTGPHPICNRELV